MNELKVTALALLPQLIASKPGLAEEDAVEWAYELAIRFLAKGAELEEVGSEWAAQVLDANQGILP